MRIRLQYYIFILLIISCGEPKPEVKLPIAKDLSNTLESNNTLFVFVGELIQYEVIPIEDLYSLDHCIKAKYKIIQPVYGNFKRDTIEFVAYDHYSERPPFLDDKFVMLFVSESNGLYYHEKYQYNSVYRTRNNRWAGVYAFYDYPRLEDNDLSIKPEKIDFINDVSFPYSVEESKEYKEGFYYPEPYYRIEGQRAFAVYGNYIEDLFMLKKKGVLKARGLF